MSWAVMRKRDIELTTDDVDTPDDDPRELVALRHNLRQLQREVEQLTEGESQQRALLAQLEQRNEHERVVRELAMRDLRRGYEDSTSWKLTRPVRAGARAVRLDSSAAQSSSAIRGASRLNTHTASTHSGSRSTGSICCCSSSSPSPS